MQHRCGQPEPAAVASTSSSIQAWKATPASVSLTRLSLAAASSSARSRQRRMQRAESYRSRGPSARRPSARPSRTKPSRPVPPVRSRCLRQPWWAPERAGTRRAVRWSVSSEPSARDAGGATHPTRRRSEEPPASRRTGGTDERHLDQLECGPSARDHRCTGPRSTPRTGRCSGACSPRRWTSTTGPASASFPTASSPRHSCGRVAIPRATPCTGAYRDQHSCWGEQGQHQRQRSSHGHQVL